MAEDVDPMTGTRSDGLRSRLEEFRNKHSLPALGAGILAQDGRLDVEVLGVSVRGGDDAVKPDDRWHIGSCGKSLTAALYARLVERGDARWGARLPDLFPDLADEIDPGWSNVTIDDVLVHQAGLPPNLGSSEMKAAYGHPKSLRDQRTEVAARALARVPRRLGRFRYSNLGYIIVGSAIERLTDLEFESALAENVLQPLGITSGGWGPPNHLWGHGMPMLRLGTLRLAGFGRGAPADPDVETSDNPPVMSPAGRLHLTLDDWAKFQRVFLGEENGFLDPATVGRLITPAPGRGTRQAMGWAPAHGLGNFSLGQQGCNTFWVATALIDGPRERTAMVVCNDGRLRMLMQTAKLAARLLTEN